MVYGRGVSVFRFSLLLVMSLLIGCESHHAEKFVYNSEVYASKEVSDFEVDHYQIYGNDNFLILNDEESLKDKSRKQSIQQMCVKYSVQCENLTLSSDVKQRSSEIVQAYSKYSGEKFFVFSPSDKMTATFVGTLNLLVHKGDEKSLDGLLARLSLSNDSEFKENLLKLKASKK